MSYRYDRQKRQKRWYWVAMLLLILIFFTPFVDKLFDIIERPLVQYWEANNKRMTDADNFFQALFGRVKLTQENQLLTDEVERLRIDNLRTAYLSEVLEGILIDTDTYQTSLILRNGGPGYTDNLIIQMNSETLFSVGDYVVSSSGVSIGTISQVYDHSARVDLYAHTKQSISVIAHPHMEVFTAHGYGNNTLIIKSPREIDFQPGDILYSQARPGSIVGIVRKIVFDPRDPFKQVYASYPVDTSDLMMVHVFPKISEEEYILIEKNTETTEELHEPTENTIQG